ncbi:MAG TPA: hypothetical protein VFA25_02705 [Actinomycetota bacterium]|nr:hypothetical protein [Actinomycetota bacterium]
MRLLRRKSKNFEIQVQDLVLRISANDDFAEESRAAALSFWEQLQSYALQHPEFRSSKRPIATPDTAPTIVQEMVASAAAAGVGPMFTFRGAVVDQVGRFLMRSLRDVTVACDGDYFIKARKRVKLAVKRHGGEPLTVALDPDPDGVGVSTTLGRGRGGGGPDGLAVIADSCMAADAAAAGVQALLPKEYGFAQAVRYLRGVPGVRGGVFVVGERIGLAGSVEIAG